MKDSDQKKSTSKILGPEVLNVQKYPLATLKIDSCEPADGQSSGGMGNYKVSGTFTLRGASRPLAFNARVEPASDPSASRVSGVFAIKQTAYGITPYFALARGGLSVSKTGWSFGAISSCEPARRPQKRLNPGGQAMIELKSVSKVHKMGPREVHSLRDVSLQIGHGEYAAIMGPSVCRQNFNNGLDNLFLNSYTIQDRDVRYYLEACYRYSCHHPASQHEPCAHARAAD